MILETINSPADVKRLSEEDAARLCQELRRFLVEQVSRTGGHLASNLGVVELTVAIHRVFDTSQDRLVFDVGHQCYVHKALTGRRELFGTLRQLGGLSGFPKPWESPHDAFIAGHASNSVSVALGMARARTLLHQHYQVLALIGDGALGGGLSFEGLNDAGASHEPMIVILNDNGMSIDPNVGGMSRHLSRLRSKPGYYAFKKRYRQVLESSQTGQKLYSVSHDVKTALKKSLLPPVSTVFEDMGFSYMGPVDGHDVEKVTEILRTAVALHEPVIVHLITQKGKGYVPAEQGPQKFHGIGKFDPDSGKALKTGAETFSDVFGKELTALAREDSRVCAITAAMEYGTGLNHFADALPNRFFDVGIAEEHAISMAAGMAKQGMIPVAAIYSTFLQRSFDMLLHDVALQQLHVVLAVDRAGLVGEDGETHHGMFDVGYLRLVPGMRVYCPANFAELRKMLREAVLECKGPVAIRYPRGGEGKCYLDVQTETCIREGADCTLVCYGTTVEAALEAADRCAGKGVSVEILKLATVAPLDFDAVAESARKTGRIVVAEETSDRGCVADELFARLGQAQIPFVGKKRNLGRRFVTHGATAILLREAGLDADGIVGLIGEVCGHEA